MDASNCFDRVAYPIVALAYAYFGLENNYIKTFFPTIQNMRMYLLTAYNISSSYYMDSDASPF